MAFIPGTNHDDNLVGTHRDDVIRGRNGNDDLRGRGGDDVLDGGNGRDRLFGGDGNDLLDGGNGRDYLNGGDGRDRLFGGNGDDTLVVDRHDRKADGGRGTDTVVLDAGDRDGHHRHNDHHDHHDNLTFDLRGVATNVENIEQGQGSATVILDTDFFLTADGDVRIDLDGGRNDTVKIDYNPRELDIDRLANGDIVFGETGGHLGNELTLVGVEHLEFNGYNYDHWLV